MDGFSGWREAAPFDAILVTAAAPVVPPLVGQLATGGRMVIPVGDPFGAQELLVITKRADSTVETLDALPVAFVPLTRSSRDASDA